MRVSASLIIATATVAVVSGIPSVAGAQSKSALTIADNEGLFIDGKSFNIVSGSTHGDGSDLIRRLDARDLWSLS